MDRHNGKRRPGRPLMLRRRRRAAPVKVYHHRMRDGQPVVWREGDGALRLMAPHDRTIEPERVAVEILADVVGRRRAWPMAADFAEWIGSMGASWDLAEGAIWMWVAARSDGA